MSENDPFRTWALMSCGTNNALRVNNYAPVITCTALRPTANLKTCRLKRIEAECIAEIGGAIFLGFFHLDANSVGNSVDCIKERSYRGSIDDRRRSCAICQRLPCSIKRRSRAGHYGFSKDCEQPAVGDVRFAGITDHDGEIGSFIGVCLQARPEPVAVADRSVIAPV